MSQVDLRGSQDLCWGAWVALSLCLVILSCGKHHICWGRHRQCLRRKNLVEQLITSKNINSTSVFISKRVLWYCFGILKGRRELWHLLGQRYLAAISNRMFWLEGRSSCVSCVEVHALHWVALLMFGYTDWVEAYIIFVAGATDNVCGEKIMWSNW